MIYFGTKELYELSNYKGIKYFRMAFLFFAFAYFFRYIIKFLIIYFQLDRIFDLSPHLIGFFAMIFFIYLSSMAIFYLLYSLLHKKLGNKKIYIFHIIAVFLAFLSSLFRHPLFHVLLDFSLLLMVLLIVYLAYKDSKNKSKDKFILYLLLSLFLILNTLDLSLPMFFERTRLFIYLASSWIFLILLYKVLRRTG